MSKKKFIILSLLTICLFVFITQNAMAGADWKQKQQKMFANMSVKPGDIIDKSSWQKVKDVLPEPVVNWVKKGEWKIKVGEFKYDFDYTPEWYKVSAKNKGKYGIGSKMEIIDQGTGSFPMFIRGLPFPDLDVKKDPQGALKLMHNNNLCLQMNGSYDNIGDPEAGCLQWIGQGGYERGVGFTMQRFYYWNRPDGERPNPNEYMHTTSLLSTRPYDITGTATLYVRYLDGRDDMVYAYVPSIRRVKRLSGANRSDPQLGSDQCMDDADGYSGHVEAMKWSYVGEQVVLVPKYVGDTQEPRILKKHKIGSWFCYMEDAVRSGWEDKGFDGAPWAWTTGSTTWVPREVWIVKGEALDPYYAYGKIILYVDKLTRVSCFNIKYNKAGEYWKMLLNAHPMTVIPDPAYKVTAKAFNLNGPMLVLDEKTHHGSVTPVDETYQMADSPRVHPRNHTPQAMRTWTK